MVEVPKVGKKGVALEVLVVSGLFMSAFYFFYFEKIDAYVKKLYDENFAPTKFSDKPRTEIDQSLYEGRKEFCSNINPKRCVRGFELPDNINDLKFINGKIRISTLPNSNLFSGLPEMAMVQLSRYGNELIYEGRINGVQGIYRESYDNVKKYAILPDNSSLNQLN